MEQSILLRDAHKTDASIIASLIMEAMTDECCKHFYGDEHDSNDFHELMTELVELDQTQYSYRNTLCATDENGLVVGVLVCYDGGQLHKLRPAFIDAVKKRYGKDFSDMPEETEGGELYLDSAAVLPAMRGKGIAKLLFKAAEERAKSMGLDRLGLLVDRGNPLAERLYRKIGFEHVGDKDWGGHTLKHMQRTL